MSDNNIVIFGYEIQHKLASEIWSQQTIQAKAAAALLNIMLPSIVLQRTRRTALPDRVRYPKACCTKRSRY